MKKYFDLPFNLCIIMLELRLIDLLQEPTFFPCIDSHSRNFSFYFILSPIILFNVRIDYIWYCYSIGVRFSYQGNIIQRWLGFWRDRLSHWLMSKIPIAKIPVSTSFLVQLGHIQWPNWLYLIMLLSWVIKIEVSIRIYVKRNRSSHQNISSYKRSSHKNISSRKSKSFHKNICRKETKFS